MAVDLSNKSRNELLALKARVEKALARLDREKRKKAIAAAEKAARAHGFTLAELGTAPAAAKAAGPAPKSAARYRNPGDPAQTWTGKGRRPAWIKVGLAAGKSLDDFAIK